jgi:hypothetical protein
VAKPGAKPEFWAPRELPPKQHLVEFLDEHLSLAEQRRLIDSIARHKGLTLNWPLRWKPAHTRVFVRNEINDDEAARYVDGLYRLQETGAPLAPPRYLK